MIAQIVLKEKKYRKSIGFIKPTLWDKKKERAKLPPKTSSKYEEIATFNNFLDKLYASAIRLNNECVLEKRSPKEVELKELLNIEQGEKPEIKEPDFFTLFDAYILAQTTTRSPNTIKGIKTVRNFLEKYQTQNKNKIKFNAIDSVFADDLINYCFNKKKIDNDYFAKIAAVLKSFLIWAKRRVDFEYKFPEELGLIKEKENEVVFLTQEELSILFNYEFPLERHRKVRDLFCFACFTGLRHCDIKTLTRENFSNGFLSKSMEKTQKGVKIPLSKFAKQILEKYKEEEEPLPPLSNQKCNDYLKECFHLIADKQNHPEDELFNRKIVFKKARGRKIEQNLIPLKDFISFHIGRKTFITNSLMLGVNLQALQEMGAPVKQKDLKKYLAIVDAFKSQEMQNSWDKIDL